MRGRPRPRLAAGAGSDFFSGTAWALNVKPILPQKDDLSTRPDAGRGGTAGFWEAVFAAGTAGTGLFAAGTGF